MSRGQGQKLRGEGDPSGRDIGPDAGTIHLIANGLHDLCQPLTALQCRLEIGLLDGSKAGITSAAREALAECARLNDYIRAMQMSLLERQLIVRGQP